jgi:hypothetical protein
MKFLYFLPKDGANLLKLLNSAAEVISYNGKNFDLLVLMKHLGRRRIVSAKKHLDLCEAIQTSYRLNHPLRLNTLTKINLGKAKHTLGREMKNSSLEKLKAACRSDVYDTYRLWKMFKASALRFPGFDPRSDDQWRWFAGFYKLLCPKCGRQRTLWFWDGACRDSVRDGHGNLIDWSSGHAKCISCQYVARWELKRVFDGNSMRRINADRPYFLKT